MLKISYDIPLIGSQFIGILITHDGLLLINPISNSRVYFPIYSNRPGYWSSFECQSFGTSLDDGSASSLLSSSRGYGHQHPQVSALINIADGQRDLKLYPFGCNMDERICILWLLSYENEKHMITASESPWDVSSIETQFISSTTVHSNGQKTPKQT